MNNKTIVEFGFRIIGRIMDISEGVIRLGRITPSEISIILHKIRKPNSLIVNSEIEIEIQVEKSSH